MPDVASLVPNPVVRRFVSLDAASLNRSFHAPSIPDTRAPRLLQ